MGKSKAIFEVRKSEPNKPWIFTENKNRFIICCEDDCGRKVMVKYLEDKGASGRCKRHYEVFKGAFLQVDKHRNRLWWCKVCSKAKLATHFFTGKDRYGICNTCHHSGLANKVFQIDKNAMRVANEPLIDQFGLKN